jgi:hypothetical protein
LLLLLEYTISQLPGGLVIQKHDASELGCSGVSSMGIEMLWNILSFSNETSLFKLAVSSLGKMMNYLLPLIMVPGDLSAELVTAKVLFNEILIVSNLYVSDVCERVLVTMFLFVVP